jgi:UDP-N-acetylmuramoyl-L-alanyl-D-glutamate--2,6-diaminopimelate ligase
MHLSELLNGLCYEIIGDSDITVASLSCSTTTVKPLCMFFCLVGERVDGHDLYRKVVGDGAIAIVCQKKLDTKVTQIVVDNSRAFMAEVAKRFYHNAAEKMKIVSVVGTNGKTSTTYLLDAIFTKAGYKTGVIGSNGIFINGHHHDSALTTPDPIELHSYFYQMYLDGVQVVFMEMSAHAIFHKKCQSLVSDVAVFTNLTQDHLDFFRDLGSYAAVKKSFFSKQFIKAAVVNIDDQLGQEIARDADVPVFTYGYDTAADFTASNLVANESGISYEVNAGAESALVSYKLSGKFNMYNTLAATAAARLFGIPLPVIVEGLSEVDYIDGRNQTILRSDGVKIVVDFAHTPDGIVNILSYLKDVCTGRLIVVFGCGGNRDKYKRPLMAEAVSQYADFAIVTNDNPRFESPTAIVGDITPQLIVAHKVILNRSQATDFALSIAKAGDTVAVLGKGAERYQEIKGRKYPYSDLEVIHRLIYNFNPV